MPSTMTRVEDPEIRYYPCTEWEGVMFYIFGRGDGREESMHGGCAQTDSKQKQQHDSYENGKHKEGNFEGEFRKGVPFPGVDADPHLGTWVVNEMSPPIPSPVPLSCDQAAQQTTAGHIQGVLGQDNQHSLRVMTK